MKFILLFISILFLTNCTKPKTVLICGDHICVNKAEAEQYFQDNLSLEVRLIDKKDKKEIDLVELNLKENQNGKKEISVISKENINKDLKILSNEEIDKIKEKIKNKNKDNIIGKIKKNKKIVKKKIKKEDKIIQKKKKEILKDNASKNFKVVDICTILEKCSIDEISKYLLKQGKKKGYPDITRRQ